MPDRCLDCLRTRQEVGTLWTVSRGIVCCALCYEVRTGALPVGLRQINERRAQAQALRGSRED